MRGGGGHETGGGPAEDGSGDIVGKTPGDGDGHAECGTETIEILAQRFESIGEDVRVVLHL